AVAARRRGAGENAARPQGDEGHQAPAQQHRRHGRQLTQPAQAGRRADEFIQIAAGMLLSLEAVETCYGRSQVLFGISLHIARGEMVTLMGRNGMGKTTTVRSIMGLTLATAGLIRFGGADIRTAPPYAIAKR